MSLMIARAMRVAAFTGAVRLAFVVGVFEVLGGFEPFECIYVPSCNGFADTPKKRQVRDKLKLN